MRSLITVSSVILIALASPYKANAQQSTLHEQQANKIKKIGYRAMEAGGFLSLFGGAVAGASLYTLDPKIIPHLLKGNFKDAGSALGQQFSASFSRQVPFHKRVLNATMFGALAASASTFLKGGLLIGIGTLAATGVIGGDGEKVQSSASLKDLSTEEQQNLGIVPAQLPVTESEATK